ncbi:hypothetical protein Adt_31203 [Abeliophyllum distichum]|uniref:Uncharacterized protein n=1 Tax=Abeliophyllum distichum TaxID=126358 RepID=A0ABD1RDF8_9LAMI
MAETLRFVVTHGGDFVKVGNNWQWDGSRTSSIEVSSNMHLTLMLQQPLHATLMLQLIGSDNVQVDTLEHEHFENFELQDFRNYMASDIEQPNNANNMEPECCIPHPSSLNHVIQNNGIVPNCL